MRKSVLFPHLIYAPRIIVSGNVTPSPPLSGPLLLVFRALLMLIRERPRFCPNRPTHLSERSYVSLVATFGPPIEILMVFPSGGPVSCPLLFLFSGLDVGVLPLSPFGMEWGFRAY